jgi:carbonic anhydrase
MRRLRDASTIAPRRSWTREGVWRGVRFVPVAEFYPAGPDPYTTRVITADQALARLVAGNQRFLRGRARFPTLQKEVLAELAKEQHPYATIVGCSDSRVPPELVFDAHFGELFIVRVAGNVISPEVMGTLQYAAVHLQTPLFVVLGHEGCGAVQAALNQKLTGARERHRIELLLNRILPGLRDLQPELSAEAQLQAAVEANVRWSMQQLLDTPEGKARMAEGILKLVGAIYELKTGRVRFL